MVIKDEVNFADIIKEEKEEPVKYSAGIVGFYNIGNTCFMNSALQILLNHPGLMNNFLLEIECMISSDKGKRNATSFECDDALSVDELMHRNDFLDVSSNEKVPTSIISPPPSPNDSKCNGDMSIDQISDSLPSTSVNLSPIYKITRDRIREEFFKLFLQYWSRRFDILKPSDFRKKFVYVFKQFANFRQHDGQEFLVLLLDYLIESTKNLRIELTGQDISQHSKRPKIKQNNSNITDMSTDNEESVYCRTNLYESNESIADIFYGVYLSRISCQNCGHVSETKEPFAYLPLTITRAFEVQIAMHLDSFLREHLNLENYSLYKIDIASAIKPIMPTTMLKNLVGKEKGVTLGYLKNRTYKMNMTTDSYNTSFFMNDETNRSLMEDMCEKKRSSSVESLEENVLPHDEEYQRDKVMDWVNSSENCIDAPEDERTAIEKSEPITESFPKFVEVCDSIPLSTSGRTMVVNSIECAICYDCFFDYHMYVHMVCGYTVCLDCLKSTILNSLGSSFNCHRCKENVEEINFELCSNVKPDNENMNYNVSIFYVIDNLTHKKPNYDRTVLSNPFLIQVPKVVSLVSLKKALISFVVNDLDDEIDDNVSILYSINGHSCGICSLADRCHGCVIVDENIVIKPGLNFTVLFKYSDYGYRQIYCGRSIMQNRYIDKIKDLFEQTKDWIDDSSMNSFCPNDYVEIQDCMEKFAQPEILDEDNPWYCSSCKTKSKASKQLLIERVPDTLIIHIKRYIFRNGCAIKINKRVTFPYESLDVSCLVVNSNSEKYDLLGCICHEGNMNVGHYTSFVRHPFDKTFRIYNDSNVGVQNLAIENAYVLVYKKQNSFEFSQKDEGIYCDRIQKSFQNMNHIIN
ncbi:hypothetical protein A3Q56_00916 [Intoshia linei]|uniref:ubiquitinyl hydrolase 1 n=1 Tax=Intoshia linei TaxID=1819745 RepID=A0A177BAJ7_9BILA|nr:hypothetical protein A3Q56_00916 [Intoshia linei]